MNSAISAMRNLLGPKGVIVDQGDIAPWLVDWRGKFSGVTPAIIAPATTAEVQAVVQIAATHRIPLVPQGGNTSMVGGATPPADGSALILSLRRMNKIRSLDPVANLAIAEAGVILQSLHDAAHLAGRRFPLSLGAKGSARIGGLVSTNAGGTQVLRFGTMRGLVLGLEAVLPDGSLYEGLVSLKKDNRGYDLTQLMIGAEGTLGIVTAAALRLVPAITESATGWFAVSDPYLALRCLREFEARSALAIESFELIPNHALDLVLTHIPGTRSPLSGTHSWHVLVDYVGDGAFEALSALIQAVIEKGLVQDAVIATNLAQADAFWRIRDAISEAERAHGPTIAHDISVSVDAMPDFIVNASAAVEAAFPGVNASAFGHLGDGNVHFHVGAPKGVDAEAWRVEVGEPASRLVYDMVVDAGGSISAEHGIGQMKLEDYVRLSAPARIAAQQAIKSALDPNWLMNPGKLLPSLAPVSHK